MSAHKVEEFRAGFLFCGLGAGALGFLRARASLDKDRARFVNLGGIDNDPLACQDFEKLTGGQATCGDLGTMQPAELRQKWGDAVPDCVFLSPPCKGFSGLLSTAQSLTPKYQLLNDLVYKGIFLVCSTWERPPGMIVLENVPRIVSRGKALLERVYKMLHADNHDCGEIGGLAQHRRRFLMVARQPDLVPAYIYRPPRHRVKACGEVLGLLPLPEEPSAGRLHTLPKLKWINWVRLSLIPAGGDWRDLPGMVPAGGEPRRRWERDAKARAKRHGFGAGSMGVTSWTEPSKTVTGESYPTNGPNSVADPRVYPLRFRPMLEAELASVVGLRATGTNAYRGFKGRPGLFGVIPWSAPAPTVSASAQVSGGNMPAAVADPRVGLDHEPRRGTFGVTAWTAPVDTVRGQASVRQAPVAVADPRITPQAGNANLHENKYNVLDWQDPAKSITGATRVGSGAPSVADPRPLALTHKRAERFTNQYRVRDWKEPAGTVTGDTDIQEGAPSVADPRPLGLNLDPAHAHTNLYRVVPWDEPSGTVTSAGKPGSGMVSVADPRLMTPVKDGQARRAVYARHDIRSWLQPMRTIGGSGSNGAYGVADPRPRFGNCDKVTRWDQPTGTMAVADPRVALNCRPRAGAYGVISWHEAAATVTGSASIDNGPMAVADPRIEDLKAQVARGEYPIIISDDSCWHRPLTTLELAALQGLPVVVDGQPLELAGKSVSSWRERIGNAVPVGAGQAIAESLLTALLAGRLGTWTLGSEGIWVRKKDGRTEYDFPFVEDDGAEVAA